MLINVVVTNLTVINVRNIECMITTKKISQIGAFYTGRKIETDNQPEQTHGTRSDGITDKKKRLCKAKDSLANINAILKNTNIIKGKIADAETSCVVIIFIWM